MIINTLKLSSEPSEFFETLDGPALSPEISSPVEVRLNVSCVSQIVVIEGHVSFRVKAECARCLSSIEPLIESTFTTQIDLATGQLRAVDLELDEEESDGTFTRLDETKIDLHGEIESRVLQSIPLLFLCREDCPGLPYEGRGGADREDDLERDHVPSDKKSPFAVLEKLLDNEDRNEKKG